MTGRSTGLTSDSRPVLPAELPHLRRLVVGLARNPRTPDELLLRVCADRDAALRAAGRRPWLSDDVALAILRHREPWAVVHFGPQKVSPRILDLLAEDEDPQLRWAHRDFTLDTRGVDDIAGLEAICRAPRLQLVSDADVRIRLAVVRCWPDAPEPVRRALLQDPDDEVRSAAEEQFLPFDVEAATVGDERARSAAAEFAGLTEEQVRRLARDPHPFVRADVASRPDLPPDLLLRLADDPSPYVRFKASLQPGVPVERREAVGREIAREIDPADGATPEVQELFQVGFDPSEPDWVLDLSLEERIQLLDSAHERYRFVLTRCRDLPESAWRRLDADPVVKVQFAAAGRPDVPVEVLVSLVERHAEPTATPRSGYLTRRPAFPVEALVRFSRHTEVHLRSLVADHPRLPVADVERLAADPESGVRRSAAVHPGLSSRVRIALLADVDGDVAEAAANAEELPVPLMAAILDRAGL